MINMKYLERFNRNSGLNITNPSEYNLPEDIPQDYLELLIITNGGEGFIGKEYLILYKAEELFQKNTDYDVNEFVPGIFLIGSNGGDEAIALDMRSKPVKYVLIPFLFEYDAIIELGNNAAEFLERIYKKGFFE